MKYFIIFTLVVTVSCHKSFIIEGTRFAENLANNLCNQQLKFFQDNLEANALWARELRDSCGNFPSGTFSGNLFDFGNFDQCIDFHHNTGELGSIIGQHCTLLIPHDRFKSDRVSRIMRPSRR